MKIIKSCRKSGLFCSKRADMSIVLLVFMTLALVGATLFLFLISGKIDKRISDAKFLETAYAVENKIEFYLADALESAIVKAYKDTASEQAFVGSGCLSFGKMIEGIGKEFCRVDSDMNVKFKEKIVAYFKDNIKSLEFPESESVLNEMKSQIEQNKFSVEFDGKSASLIANSINIKSKFNKEKTIKMLWLIPIRKEKIISIESDYNPNIMISIALPELGLHDFNTIYEKTAQCINENSLDSCKNSDKDKIVDSFKVCMNNRIEDFAVYAEARCDVYGSDTYYLTTLTSKNEFLIDKSFETISMKFLTNATAQT